MDTTKKSAKRKAALIMLSWMAVVVGDVPTRRWASLYGCDVHETHGTINEIQRSRSPRDGLQ